MAEPSADEMELLRARARERITQGRLPRTKAVRTWGGVGVGLTCCLCDAAILSSEPEFELQFDLLPASTSLRFHRHCHAIWSEVREEYRPPEWCLVSEQLPPFGSLVEARVRLGATRSIILNLICSSASSGAGTWVNGTTGDPLPEGWQPIEWRHAASVSGEPGRGAEPRARSDSGRDAQAARRSEPAADPRDSSMPRRA
jgi:hypothetical protein